MIFWTLLATESKGGEHGRCIQPSGPHSGGQRQAEGHGAGRKGGGFRRPLLFWRAGRFRPAGPHPAGNGPAHGSDPQPEDGDQERAWDAESVPGFRRICCWEERRLPSPQRRQPGGWSEGPGHEAGELSSRRGRSLPPAGDGGGEAQSPEAGGALPGEGYREWRREVLRRRLCQHGRRAGGGRRKAQHRGRQLCPAGTAPGGGGCPAALF